MVDKLVSEFADDGVTEMEVFGGRALAVHREPFAILVDEHLVVDLGSDTPEQAALLAVEGTSRCAGPQRCGPHSDESTGTDRGADEGDWVRLPSYQCTVWEDATRQALRRVKRALSE